MTKFQIGDVVYRAQAGQKQVWVTCPECLGSGRLRVILGDDSEVSIHCECCSRGYEGSPGLIQTYHFIGEAVAEVLTGVEITSRDGELRETYKVGSWSIPSEDFFATRDEALARALTLVAEHEAEEKKRLGYKEKQHKTWAGNVSYWRNQIRRNKEEIARYEARLAVAPHTRKESAQRDTEEKPNV